MKSKNVATLMARRYEGAALDALLPHRYPFVLVDRIDIIEPGKHVVGSKQLSGSEWWSDNRAAGTMPFALVLEALAQTSGALIPDLVGGSEFTTAYFMGADRVRFRQPALAGERLWLDVTLQQWRRGICRTRGVATINEAVVVTATLTTVVRAT
jgi:3-hydroxymyristoyl/3-hydroxydecanoyl-(acyl carrier protein) dehydratase